MTGFTIQEAADIINVSPEFLQGLLDRREIAFTTSEGGTRLARDDLIAYKERRDRDRRSVLADLTQMSEEVGGYTELD